eukprot:EC117890.1.p1 GENE.EC117890.1~~EC117890.1.p1  ORF type:complete len:101 (+),score=13.58 EC117890.1:102-404(+)
MASFSDIKHNTSQVGNLPKDLLHTALTVIAATGGLFGTWIGGAVGLVVGPVLGVKAMAGGSDDSLGRSVSNGFVKCVKIGATIGSKVGGHRYMIKDEDEL